MTNTHNEVFKINLETLLDWQLSWATTRWPLIKNVFSKAGTEELNEHLRETHLKPRCQYFLHMERWYKSCCRSRQSLSSTVGLEHLASSANRKTKENLSKSFTYKHEEKERSQNTALWHPRYNWKDTWKKIFYTDTPTTKKEIPLEQASSNAKIS